MTFRARLALVAAAAVALAVVVASFVVYFVVRSELRSPIDDSLKRSAAEIQQSPSEQEINRALFHLTAKLGGAAGYPQVVKPDGTSIPAIPAFGPKTPLPVDDQDREVARGERGTFLRDATVAGTHVRMITFPVPSSVGLVAVQVVRPLTEVDDTLGRVENFLILIGGLGIAIAAGLGLLVARAALAPVRRLTTATETVTKTGDLSQRIDDRGSDELSRLAASFNAMLAALEESSRAQRQLVADASHELRTPLTSLRTNIEVLASDRELPPGERERLLEDVIEQLGEMTTLIAELMDLARGEEPQGEPEEIRLDLLTADAVERARRNRPAVTFVTDLEESVVHGVPANARARRREPARQRREVEPAERPSRGRRPRWSRHRSRPRPGHRRGGLAVRLRSLLPRVLRAWASRLRPRACDRAPGRGCSRRHRRRRAG